MTEMGFDSYSDFRDTSRELAQDVQTAADALDNALTSNPPQSGDSPLGQRISLLTNGIATGFSPVPPQLSNDAQSQDSKTNMALSSIENQDTQNASGFQNGSTPGQGLVGSGTPGSLNPESIDQEAKDKAEQMLGDDQAQQMMQQMMQMGAQTGGQIAQQLSQQLSQIGSKLNEAVSKAGEQVGQLVGKVAEQAAESATEVATPDLGLDGLGGGGFGGGGGGGMDPGTTMPAGLQTPVAPMNTSSALQSSSLQAPGGGSPTSAAGSRMPMMPMMPMHGMHGQKQGAGEGINRDPAIFPEGKIYDAPQGVEQTFGAIPEIESEEPPFGTTTAQ
ncbi:MAG: hypothetical protein U5N53_11970 [Mycobacterium sp.]|nr:hypothetical protein [Mycobacterium sp.]